MISFVEWCLNRLCRHPEMFCFETNSGDETYIMCTRCMTRLRVPTELKQQYLKEIKEGTL